MLLCSRIRVRSVFPIYRNGVRGMNTLKEILVDAARYRWLRENAYQFVDWLDAYPHDEFPDCDSYIDERLSSVE